MREIRMLKQLRHHNIVWLIEVFRRRGKLHLIFEYVEKTLLSELESTRGGLPMTTVKNIMYQLVSAIKFWHSNNVIHRDIKPENVLISDRGVLKLWDFGFARSLAG